ncbi:MAG TPA: hypothetical protein VH418_12170 [Solirubrobacteraceae bacterium]
MDRERFDDVAYSIVEEPEPPKRRRPRHVRRWAVGAGAALIVAGGLAAGASALTDSGGKAKPPTAANERGMQGAGWTAYAPLAHHGCHRHRVQQAAPPGSDQ